MNIPINPFVYRGKELEVDKLWHYGFLWMNETIPEKPVATITEWKKINGVNTALEYRVDPSTLGVSWGMKDRSGKLIFTGMRVRYYDFTNVYAREVVGVVALMESCFCIKYDCEIYGHVCRPIVMNEDQFFAEKKIEIIEED